MSTLASNAAIYGAVADALKGLGFTVKKWPGWATRTASHTASRIVTPTSVCVHHTAGNYTRSEYIRDGDAGRDLPGPLTNWHITRDGVVHLLGCGYQNHAGLSHKPNYDKIVAGTASRTSSLKPGPESSTFSANRYMMAVEVNGDGGADDFTPLQYRAAVALAAECHRVMGWKVPKVGAHKELTTRKPGDPVANMGVFRCDVLAALAQPWGPKAGPVPVPAGTAVRVATLNCLDPQIRQGDPAKLHPLTAARKKALVKVCRKARADFYCLTEAPEATRDAIRAGMPGGAKRWKVWERGSQAIMFDSVRATHGSADATGWGYHGAVAATFAVGSQPVTVGSYHLPPDSTTATGKQQELMASWLAVVAKRTGARIIGGDGMNSPDWAPGWTDARKAARASSSRDKATYKTAITDRILSLGDVTWRGYNVLDAGVGSDHNLVVTALTINRAPLPTN